MLNREVLILDPILRGSRLFFTSIVAAGAHARGLPVHILTRQLHGTPHVDELLGKFPCKIEPVLPVPKELWFGLLKPDVVDNTVRELSRLCAAHPVGLIYVCGIKEYFPLLLEKLLDCPDPKLRATPWVLVEYDSEHLLKNHGRPLPARFRKRVYQKIRLYIKYRAQRQLHLRFLARYPLARIGVLDERVFDPELSRVHTNPRFFSLADPGPALPRPVETQRQGPLRLLLLGVQTRRKGLREIIRLLNRHPIDPDRIRFRLLGKLTPETEDLRPQLRKLSAMIEWLEDYVPEDAVRREYDLADYLVMPYTPDFCGSSGVLAYATAHAKPLLVTGHGCIGYRVSKLGLGLTYKAGDIQALHQLLSNLPTRDSTEYAGLCTASRAYADRRDILAHQASVFAALTPTA